jgi:hypothetical protein
MIWKLEDETPLFERAGAFSPHNLDVFEDLRTRIKRQVQKFELEIVYKEVPAVWKLELLSDRVNAGNRASSFMDSKSTISS